jgi:hypothetical protein
MFVEAAPGKSVTDLQRGVIHTFVAVPPKV